MLPFLTVKEAAQFTGKSPSSIRRVIYPIIHEDKHADREHIQPTVENAMQLRVKGENFAWRLSEELLRREVPVESPHEKARATATRSPVHSESDLLAMLRGELQIKNQQIVQQGELIARQMELINGLLGWTPATTALLMRASNTFDGEAFTDERRLRERLQAFSATGIVRSWSTAQAGGGLQNYYKLTPLGFDLCNDDDVKHPPRAFFDEVSPSMFAHTFRLAEVIIEIMRACHAGRVTIDRFIRENEVTFSAGDRHVQPDCFFRLATSGRAFNLAFEIDNSTESVDAYATNSIRQKLTTYQTYQDKLLCQWLAGGKKWERPRFRVVFLTRSVERAYHILSFAAEATPNKSRRLVYAATQECYVTNDRPLHAPIFLDHFGNWQSLIDLHPSAAFMKTPVRLTCPLDCPLAIV